MEIAEHHRPSPAPEGSRMLLLFWALVLIYFMLLLAVLSPAGLREGPRIVEFGFFAAMALLVLLGAAEIIETVRSRTRGHLRLFLLLTGVAAIGTPVSIFLHNFVSMLVGSWFGWKEEGFFFILALFVFPLVFLVGVCGTVITILRFGGSGRLLRR